MGLGRQLICASLCFTLLCFTLSAANPCRIKTKEEIETGLPELERRIEAILATTNVTGLSLTIFENGRLLFEKSYGDALTQPMFQAASISKAVSAFGALKLVQESKLSLDDSLSRYVVKPYLPAQEFTELVAMRMILNHTSGMSNDVTGVDRKLYFKPGTQYSYSGGGFLYLQQAMEDTAKVPFADFMSAEMKGLGMTKSTFHLYYQGEHFVGAPYSLVTTPGELALFFDELAHPRSGNMWIAAQMTTPSFLFSEDYSRGLGVVLTRCGSDLAISHSGSNFGIHKSQAVVYQKARVGIVVMARGKDSYEVPQTIAEEAIGGISMKAR